MGIFTESSERGVIFDIQHFSLHDGPGVRSTVFFKGCPLSCAWCSNPESQRRVAELLFFKNNCTRCGCCVTSCPNGALSMDENGISTHRKLCVGCGECVSRCPQNARSLSGKVMDVGAITDEVRQHWRIFMQSGGGITCSGGEALAQPAFLKALLESLHEELGFHTCIETCGHTSWDILETILPHTDMVLLDIKHMNCEKHREGTGQGNQLILENAARLARLKIQTLIRLPLIPGFNDDEDNLNALAAFMKKNGLLSIEILPYHTFGVSKHEALGKTYTLYKREKTNIPGAEAILKSYGLEVELAQRQDTNYA
jgi:pyruvate formate lyase activating enzyme